MVLAGTRINEISQLPLWYFSCLTLYLCLLCAGNTSPVGELNIPSFCLDDGPAGLRIPSKGTTGLPAAINAASTFSRRLMHARGVILGKETHDKGTQ